ALFKFIDKNAPQLDERQSRSVLQLVTWPVRDPDNFAEDVGWVAMHYFPDSTRSKKCGADGWKWVLSTASHVRRPTSQSISWMHRRRDFADGAPLKRLSGNTCVGASVPEMRSVSGLRWNTSRQQQIMMLPILPGSSPK